MSRSLRAGVAGALIVLVVAAAPVSAAGPAGSLDTTFNKTGYLTVPTRAPTGAATVNARLAVAPNGRTYVAVLRSYATHNVVSDVWLEITAFTKSGHIDPAFNGGRPYLWARLDDTGDTIYGPFVTASGGVLVGIYNAMGAALLYQLTAAGKLDRTFSGDGRGVLPTDAQADQVADITRLPGGSLRGCGASLLYGLTAAGKRDTRVGGDGRSTLDIEDCRAIANDIHGRLYAAGSHGPVPTVTSVVRLSSSGAPDAGWGSAGSAEIGLATSSQPVVGGLAPATDGSVYVALSVARSAGTGSWGEIAKVSPVGAPDPGFGGGGGAARIGPEDGTSRVSALTVDGSGRPVAGVSRVLNGVTVRELVRLRADTGALDPAFRGGGSFAVSGLVLDLAMTASGRIEGVSVSGRKVTLWRRTG